MNYRRGLGRIGKLLKVWGYLVSGIAIIAALGDLFLSWNYSPDPWNIKDPTKVLGPGALIGWAPFLLFKLLFWIGDGFTDDDNDN